MFERRLGYLFANNKLTKNQIQTLKKFDQFNAVTKKQFNTRLEKLRALKDVAIKIKKPFNKVTKDDLIKYFSKIMRFKESTYVTYQAHVKSFFKWFYNTEDSYPELVKWIKTSRKANQTKLPEDLISEEEIKKIAKSTFNPRDRAIIMTLYESACRIGEIISLKMKNVEFDKYGAKLIVTGKTGMRRVRLIHSVPDLKVWMNYHPYRDDPEAFLFVPFEQKQYTKGISWSYVYSMLQRAMKNAGLKKKIHPHLLRHSRLTHLAKMGLNESTMRIIAGWSGDSRMPKIYLHLSGQDVDDKILELSGIKKIKGKKSDKILKPKECPRCKQINPLNVKFCYGCSLVLDTETAMKFEKWEKIKENLFNDPEVLEILERRLSQKSGI